MTKIFPVLVLCPAGCSVSTTQPTADGGPVGDAPLTCADVWQHFDARERELHPTCEHVRPWTFNDYGCIVGTHPSAAQLASCGALIDAAVDCESLADGLSQCEGAPSTR